MGLNIVLSNQHLTDDKTNRELIDNEDEMR